MEIVRDLLRGIFSYLLYPTVVIGLFVYIAACVGFLVMRVEGEKRIRRLVAAALPVVVLVFVLISVEEPGNVGNLLGGLHWGWRFLIGAMAGVAILELGRKVFESDNEVGPAIYILFLSGVSMFILYSVMEDFLRSLHVLLLGMTLAGGFHVIFRGVPRFSW